MKQLRSFLRPALLLFVAFIFCGAHLGAASSPSEEKLLRLSDAAYKSGDKLTEYERERCRLDVYGPAGKDRCPVFVWFHGGGLTSGGKNAKNGQHADAIARVFANEGVITVVVNYRFSPKVKYPAYVDDAAAAVAWTVRNIGQHGGDPDRIFIGGHSAGGYLAAMLGVDPGFLRKYDIETDRLRGVISISGQMVTHSTVRAERGLKRNDIIVDDAAPLRHVRASAPPFLLLYADKDMAARVEECRYFAASMKAAGHRDTEELLVTGRDHGNIARSVSRPDDPAKAAILDFISRHSAPRSAQR